MTNITDGTFGMNQAQLNAYHKIIESLLKQ